MRTSCSAATAPNPDTRRADRRGVQKMIATTMMIRIKAPMLMLMLRFMAGPPYELLSA